MMLVKDEWVRAAMTDDRVVVELLVRLKQAQAEAAPPATKSAVAALRWGIRQPRSRAVSTRCDGKKDGGGGGGDSNISSRGSPTTPLSWSGGGGAASPSTADGFEETSGHAYGSQSTAGFRSKGIATTESKKSRRRKTFAELKEEESVLLKEKVHLKKEIASMRVTFKEQRAENSSLKRMKVDLNFNTANESSLTASERDEHKASSSITPQQRVASAHPLDNEGSSFVLPDLNMMPTEDDDSGPEMFFGTS